MPAVDLPESKTENEEETDGKDRTNDSDDEDDAYLDLRWEIAKKNENIVADNRWMCYVCMRLKSSA